MDKYHLQVRIELTRERPPSQWQLHLLLPGVMDLGTESYTSEHFYRNLIQQQTLEPLTPPSQEELESLCRQMTLAHRLNSRAFQRLLADLVRAMRIWLAQADSHSLLALRPSLLRLLRLNPAFEDESRRKLFLLTREQLLFQLHQALLRESLRSGEGPLRRYLRLTERIAELARVRLTHHEAAGREKGLDRLSLGRRIIERPYQLTRRVLKGPKLAEQLIFGLAAAVAMTLATTIAFATQRAFGSFSTPFFLSLVISYIFKDRLKEVGRLYLLSQFYTRFSQHHYRLYRDDGTAVVDIRDTFLHLGGPPLRRLIDDMKERLPPGEGARIDAGWVYHRSYGSASPVVDGHSCKLSDQLVINLSRSLRLQPSQRRVLWQREGERIRQFDVQRVIPVYLLLNWRCGQQQEFKVYRLHVSRKGIHRLKEVSPHSPGSPPSLRS
ncbi:hypothetical protein FCL40_00660 [Ferrimonas sediminicola]|uniref:Uncharacterized protein n=1 Tax=Ferrimonas sediminicola TaxID=2569538 RepID=A0A4U1BI47_9GAMM|nr:hypothetical protein [Ferrimonas sediminicola]TKB51100.1 hypothetical protein FCL40_00660 [Ferrimonas sediminicola]